MKLYLMRHANADWPDWNKDDDLRPLTENGHAQAQGVAQALSELENPPRLIFSSPLPRALQTALAAHESLGGRLTKIAQLQPGATPEIFMKLLREAVGDVLMVGHEPDLSLAVLEFTGELVRMRKASVACIEFDENFNGRMLWHGRL